MPTTTTIAPGRFACVYCNQTFHFSSDLDDHKCALAPTPSAVKHSPAAKSAESAKEQGSLLPCPCCAGDAYLADAPDQRKFCVCPACGLQTGSHFTEEAAAEVWNRRPAPPAPAAKPRPGEYESAFCSLLDKLPMDLRPALQAWVMMRRRKRYPISVDLVAKWSAFLAKHGEAAFVAALVHSTTEEYRALVPAPREAQAPKVAKKGADHARGF